MSQDFWFGVVCGYTAAYVLGEVLHIIRARLDRVSGGKP